MVVHTLNSSAQEAEAGSEFKANFVYTDKMSWVSEMVLRVEVAACQEG